MDEKNQFRGFYDDIVLPEDFEEDEEEADDNVEDEASKEEETSEDETETTDVKGEKEEVETEEEKTAEETEAERNAKFAEKRRAKEAKEREAREAKIKEAAKLEVKLGIIKENPYTNKPVKDEEDLKIYELMKEIDESGGDPINDLPERIAADNRKLAEERRAKEAEEVNRQNKTNEEVKELSKAYPELNLMELSKDNEYLQLCESKGGRWTMLECYEYLVSKREKQKTAEKAKEEDETVKEGSKKVTKVPSSTNGKKHSSQNYLEMTDEEYIELQKQNNKDFF